MFEVGQKVRVSLAESVSCRAMIATSNEDDDTYDIIYSISGCMTEENRVIKSRISNLQWFELNKFDGDPLSGKEFGNTLFQLKDFDSAIEYYSKSLAIIAPSALQVGGRALVLTNGLCPISVTIAEVSARTCDVLFDRPVEGKDEENDVPNLNIVTVANENHIPLQAALFMNLARSYLKLKRNGWAIRFCTLAIGLLSSDAAAHMDYLPKLKDAYLFRSKAFLIAHRPGRALQDSIELNSLGDISRAEGLKQQIECYKFNRRKEDRKLAKEVAKWVQSALEISESKREADIDIDAIILDDI